MKLHIYFVLSLSCLAAICSAQAPKPMEKVDTYYKTEVHLRINQVTDGNRDTMWLMLAGGTRLGIKPGLKGHAVTVYNTLQKRTYEILSPVYVVSASSERSKAYILLPSDAPASTYLLEGDQALFTEVEIKSHGNNDLELFRPLGAFNIIFQNSTREPIYSQDEVLTSTTLTGEKLVNDLLDDVISSANYLDSMTDKQRAWTEPQTGGKFKGLGVLEAMKRSSTLDMESFIRFVNDFPGKYLGNNWKINETYATWIINNTPMANSEEYVFKEFLGVSADGVNRWLKDNSWYLDSSFNANLKNTIQKYLDGNKNDSLRRLLDRAEVYVKLYPDKKFEAELLIDKARLLVAISGKTSNDDAIALYTRAIGLDKNNANAYWYRGNIYSDQDIYPAAIADFTKVNALVPGFASAWGNTGWLLLKQLRVAEAAPYIRKSYELDPSASAWNINMAHYFLFINKTDSARKFYQQALEHLSTASEFTDGLMGDFTLFLKTGLFQDALTRERDWMQLEFSDNFKHYLVADSLFALAKEFKEKDQFLQAINYFGQSRAEEQHAKKTRPQNIHNITTWIGYTNFLNKKYPEAEQYYKEALQQARLDLKGSVSHDLDLMTDLYAAWNKVSLADSYRAETNALKQKEEEDGVEKNLYIVSIGVDKYRDVNYQWAAADAKRIAEEFKAKGKGFDHVFPYTLTNSQAVSDTIDKTMAGIFAKSGPWDTFIFYFTGKAVTHNNESYLIPYNFTEFENDSLLRSRAISARLLRSWSNNIAATHQFYLLDAATSFFPSTFASEVSLLRSLSKKDLTIMSASFPRIENEKTQSSVLAGSMFALLSDSSTTMDKMLTAKRVENFMADNITRNNYFLGIETFSMGRDFVLANYNNSPPPRLVIPAGFSQTLVKRGAGDDEDQSNPELTIGKRYVLLIATDKYKDPHWKRLFNPIKDARDLSRELESDYGFETDTLFNPTTTQIYGKLDEYTKKKFDKNDQLVILFAGHGHYAEREKDGYLVPSDATYTELEFARNYISFSTIVNNLKSVKAKHMLVLVDACHGGALVEKATMRDAGGDLYSNSAKEDRIEVHLRHSNRLIITSGRSDQNVYDGSDGKNSPFIASILEALKCKEVQERGIATYHLLMKYITDKQKTEAAQGKFGPEDNDEFLLEYKPNKAKNGIDPSSFGKK